jgi:4,5-DOPA dioxygenase extradiol
MAAGLKRSERMPVLFLGHGSPMNAIEENEFVRGFRNIAGAIQKPAAILCVSAHWETNGTYVTAMKQPRTIHDFGGFPEALYAVQYPAPGNPALAKEIQAGVKHTQIAADHGWGLDHGAWSVIKHLYPEADVPVLQLSLDSGRTPAYHYELAKELAFLRDRGVLIVGSGNIVHNLRRVAWDKLDAGEYGYDWALEANAKVKEFILGGKHNALIDYKSQGPAFQMSIPTPEHYLPLLYALALRKGKEEVHIFNDKAVGGSITMTSMKIG